MNTTSDHDDITDGALREMVVRIQHDAPTAPAFHDLHPTAPPKSSRVLASAAAVALIAVGVGGIVVLSGQSDAPGVGPLASSPVPVQSSADTTPGPGDDATTGKLLSTPLGAGAVPFPHVPGGVLTEAYGETFRRDPGDLENGVAFVGDDATTWEAPLLTISVLPTKASDIDPETTLTSEPIDDWEMFDDGLGPDFADVGIAGTAGRASVTETAVGDPLINVFFPLTSGDLLRVIAVGISFDDTVAHVDEVIGDVARLGTSPIEIAPPTGFRALAKPVAADETSYVTVRYSLGGREIEINAQNSGAIGVLRSGALAGEGAGRVVDGVDVNVRTNPDAPSRFMVDWYAGD